MARLSGNDISRWQGDIDFGLYKNHTNFVIIKATDGYGFTDPKFIKNRDMARNAGIAVGFYHFARPDLGNSPEREAQYFLDIVGGLRKGELLALDYELLKTSDQRPEHVAWCRKWCDYILAKTGVRPLIYMSESVALKYDWKPLVDGSYGLWLARYATPRSPDASYQTGKWPFAAMYQWTSEQRVPGIVGNVDGNVFYGDKAALMKYGYQPSEPTPPVEDTITIKRTEYNAMKQKISDLSGANERLTKELALKDQECEQKLRVQKEEIRTKITNLAGSL